MASAAYLLVTFPLAIVWHMVLFGDLYTEIGYIARNEPSFVLGFLSILAQGILLSLGYAVISRRPQISLSGLSYALMVGLFFWTSHVLGFAAKVDIDRLEWFFPLETLYLFIQFGIYGFIVNRLFSKTR